jgi:hypothetical protein
MLAPVRQSPTRSWESSRSPTVGVGVALGLVGPGRGLVVPAADVTGWPEPSEKTTAATIAAHTAATAPAVQGHRLRRRGPGCMSGEYHWLPCGPG